MVDNKLIIGTEILSLFNVFNNFAIKNQNIFIPDKLYFSIMPETITIPKQEYEELLEEVGIVRNKEIMEAIKESDEVKEKGVKTWGLKTHK